MSHRPESRKNKWWDCATIAPSKAVHPSPETSVAAASVLRRALSCGVKNVHVLTKASDGLDPTRSELPSHTLGSVKVADQLVPQGLNLKNRLSSLV